MYACMYVYLHFHLIIITGVNMWGSELPWLDITSNISWTGLSMHACQLGVYRLTACTYVGS